MERNVCEMINAEKFRQLLTDEIDAVLFDIDGTLWHWDTLIPGAISLTNRLLEMGKQVGYVTNSCVRTHAEMVRELQKRGFQIKQPELVMCTSRAAAFYLAEKFRHHSNGTAFVLADFGVVPELGNFNIKTINEQDFDGNYDKLDADAVVLGFDRSITYRRLEIAAHLLRKKKEAIFLATNLDTTFPGQGGRIFPDTGALAAALIAASGRSVEVNVGKPGPIMFEQLAKQGIYIDPKRVLVIGDRCETDIGFASSIGGRSILVLTGISTLEDARNYANASHQPDFIASSVELLDDLLSKQ